jgi:hypothetical protein
MEDEARAVTDRNAYPLYAAGAWRNTSADPDKWWTPCTTVGNHTMCCQDCACTCHDTDEETE